MANRNYKYDSIKGLLILLVILGHCIEKFEGGDMLYRIIYSFHMPAFVFVSGYFVKYNPRRIFSNLIVPYALFQPLYLFLEANYFHPEKDFVLQYTTPFWILWYLLAMILFSVTLPFISYEKTWAQILILAITTSIALVVGLDSTIGYYMSLSRFFVFLPFFVWGYYAKRNASFIPVANSFFGKLLLSALLLVSFSFVCITKKIPTKGFYGSYAYAELGYSLQARFIIMVIAIIGILFLHAMIPEKKLPFLSALGQHTFPIYLMHAGFVLLAEKINLFQFGLIENMIISIGLVIVLCTVFGNKYFDKLFRFLVIHQKK